MVQVVPLPRHPPVPRQPSSPSRFASLFNSDTVEPDAAPRVLAIVGLGKTLRAFLQDSTRQSTRNIVNNDSRRDTEVVSRNSPAPPPPSRLYQASHLSFLFFFFIISLRLSLSHNLFATFLSLLSSTQSAPLRSLSLLSAPAPMKNPFNHPVQRFADFFKPRPRMYGYWGQLPMSMPVT